MKTKAKTLVFWPSINQDIDNYVAACERCATMSPSRPRENIDHKWPEAKCPFDRVHLDYAGPIFGGYWLIIIDAYSRYPFAKFRKSITSASTIKILQDIFSMFGSPTTLVSDNGTQFASQEMAKYLEQQGTKHLFTALYHPSSNGLAERMVRTFKEVVKKLTMDGYEAIEAAEIFLQDYRATEQSTTGKTPALKFLGKEIRTPINRINMDTDENRELIDKQTKYEKGDEVYVKNYTKSREKWHPATIEKIMGNRMYTVRSTMYGMEIRHEDQIKHRVKTQ